MKKLLYLSVALSGLFMASCASDKKDDPNAPEPTTDPRDKFVAYWNVNENSATAGTNTHTVNIIKSTTNSSEVLINNFSGLSVSARATINNSILTIPYQQIGSIGFTKGSGTLTNATNISMSYTTTISTSRDSCTATYTKQ
ncbi:MAG: hypothetical protein K0S53_1672 [Bacteroidetes bacterium]|jgi:hypothetical protein|nr:hypothetical protein [Bacteroidota bacterium]MDF2451252.1 hypothetical protein [Bacteroidota bacterium]